MSALLKALIVGRPYAFSSRKYLSLDFDDVRPATKSLELFKLMHGYLLVETFDAYTPSILEAWNQLGVVSFSSYSSTSEGKTNLDPIL